MRKTHESLGLTQGRVGRRRRHRVRLRALVAPKRLYARRLAEIRAESPRGPVIGRLHPGASVSLVEDDASSTDPDWVRVGDLAPKADKKALVALVERNALGGVVSPAPREVRPGSEVRATFGYLSFVWYERGKEGPLRFRRCHATTAA